MNRALLIAAALLCGLTVTAGWVEGHFTNRWGEPVDLALAGRQLADVPARVGAWEMQSTQPLDDEVASMLQCAGSFLRVYANPITGESVSVALVVGPPGPTAAHTPEVCFSSTGKVIDEASLAFCPRPDVAPDESLWRVAFRSSGADPQLLRVVYGWRAPDGPWQAARDPRFEYSGQPLLYKLQLACLTSERSNQTGYDPCLNFLHDFLPALEESLFNSSAQTAAD